ncbi:MAG: hypothetical protein KF834_00865 [Burkholderiales bacterium]|nr:hypothetical protein [Burkholderiales bacterium]
MAQDYALRLTGTGMRDYYCQIVVRLENRTDAPLAEIAGHFHSYIGQERVGRSRGAWFMNVPSKGTAEATFETPNAPCKNVERYEFVISACRTGTAFEDRAACAARIGVVAPIAAVVGD